MRMQRIVIALLAAATLGAAPATVAAQARPRGQAAPSRADYNRGYRDGLRDGERDARRGRAFDYDHDRRLTRQPNEFQRGYADGYRAGYERLRGARGPRANRGYNTGGFLGRERGSRRDYHDPAFARGYSEGYERGLDDGRDRDRYDPVRHRDYRDADDGYFRDYGPKGAYENNYRAGFRQGYEEGYRDGNRRR